MEVSNISATIGDSIKALRRRIKLPQLLTIVHGQMEDVVFHSMHASQYISGPTDYIKRNLNIYLLWSEGHGYTVSKVCAFEADVWKWF